MTVNSFFPNRWQEIFSKSHSHYAKVAKGLLCGDKEPSMLCTYAPMQIAKEYTCMHILCTRPTYSVLAKLK